MKLIAECTIPVATEDRKGAKRWHAPGDEFEATGDYAKHLLAEGAARKPESASKRRGPGVSKTPPATEGEEG